MKAERYDRQIILRGFGEEAQSRLSAARVLVIGAGGLGCPILQYLAASGTGHIGIVDDFSTADIGKLKTIVATERLQEMNPEIEIKPYALRIQKSNILDLLKTYDIIIDGTDNFDSRYLINDACALLKKPLIFAAVSGYEGQLAIFNVKDDQGKATNYRDIFPVPPKAGEIPNCAENGVLGVLPGIIGTMAAAETIKLITGIGKPLVNTLLHYNLLNQEQYQMQITSATDYTLAITEDDFLNSNDHPDFESSASYIEIDAIQMRTLQQLPSTLLIDVRERHEFPVLDPATYIKVPMSEFNAFLNTDIQEENILLLCQHGIRSVAAAEALQEKYGHSKKIYSLKGGIVKWRDHF
jgi:molybdopterin/thiamine biosynthesis adenylyltransferase/rhodanese-related sulfurtransferase